MMKTHADNQQKQITELLKNRDDNETAKIIEMMKEGNKTSLDNQAQQDATNSTGQSEVSTALQMMQGMMQQHGDLINGLHGTMKQLASPKILVKDAQGKIIGAQHSDTIK
jgi:predicted class III extradiol MEMO1 family dioxygenase